MSASREQFLAREQLTVAERTRGAYAGPILKKLAELEADDLLRVLTRILMAQPIVLRRHLYRTLARDLRRGGQ